MSTEKTSPSSSFCYRFEVEQGNLDRIEALRRLYGRLCLRYGVRRVNRHWHKIRKAAVNWQPKQ